MFRMYRRGANQKDIASTFDCSEQTVSKYKKKFNWDERRRELEMSTQASVEKLSYLISQKLNSMDGENDGNKSDELAKLAKVKSTLERDIDPLGSTIMVIEDFIQYLNDRGGQAYQVLQEVIPDFLAHQRKKYDPR